MENPSMNEGRSGRGEGGELGEATPPLWRRTWALRNVSSSGAGVHGFIGGGHTPTIFKRKKHICDERQRRVRMNTLLESLQEVLPDPSPRRDRCALLMDTIDYLHSLEERIQELATLRENILASRSQVESMAEPKGVPISSSRPSHKINSSDLNVVEMFQSCKVMKHDDEVVVTFISPCIKGILCYVLKIFGSNQFNVITANCSSTSNDRLLLYVHAKVPHHPQYHVDDVKALLYNADLHRSMDMEKKES